MKDYVIAKYIRLSIEDGITESMSIPSQRKMLDQYIDKLDIPTTKILEFVDNGHTGTVMERPAMQEMLDIALRGGIQCIIIKDLSRFSRNATESSYLIDRIFPLYRVRFISIADSFDSGDYKETTGGINVGFKYVIHDYYSRDLSKKVKSAKRIQMAQGKNIVANAIYGYRKNEKGKWEPDPVPAEVVKQIFQMALEGLATAQIRDKLCAARYPTPREYIEMRRGKDIVPECMWTTRMVLHTLNNEQYTGSYISGKQESKAVGSHSKKHMDKSEWIIIPDSHPPLIDKKDFIKVQELLARRKGAITTKPNKHLLKDDMSRPRRLRMVNGDQIAGTPIYGYLKTDSGSWKIDEIAGKVVREIYEMAFQGLSCSEISDKLFNMGYETPFEYIKRTRGDKIAPTHRWTAHSVRSILKNEQYTGAYVSGKILKDFEDGRSYHTPKDEWIVIPGKHPAIISKELFDNVQEITAKSRFKRKNTHPGDYLLRGKIACGCCRYALSYDNSTENKVYRCHHTYADPNVPCHKMKVSAPELDEAILTMIKKQAEAVLNDGDIAKMMDMGDIKQKFSEYEAQIRQVEEQRKNCYEQFINLAIDRDSYLTLKNEYTKEIDRITKQLAVLKKTERDKHSRQKSTAIAKEALSESAIPRIVVETLIEKVYVFPDNRIEVNWKISNFTDVEKNR